MSARPTGHGYPERAPGLRVAAGADGYVVRQPARGRVHHLNATAALVLELCTGDVAWADVVRLAAEAAGAPPGAVDAVESVLRRAVDEGLVVVRPASRRG